MRKAWHVAAVVAVAALAVVRWLARDDAGDRLRDASRPSAPEAEAPALAASDPAPAPAPTRTGPTVPPSPSPDAPSSGPGRLVVAVVGTNGEPIAGATVRLSIARGEVSAAAGACVTDEEGRCEPDLSALWALAPVHRAAARLGIRVAGPGHRSCDADGDVAVLEKGAVVERRVMLARGAALRGRVVSASGPVAGAEVVLERPGFVDRTWCDGDGRFALAIHSTGPHRLTGAKSGVGAAGRRIDLDAARDAEADDLVLAGPGVIEGVARFPDGKPVAGLRVRARDVSGPLAAWTAVDSATPPTGLVATIARTDDQGRFRLAGLRSGRYVVSDDLGGPTGPEHVHETGATDVVLVVRHARLRFPVVDEAGDPVPGAGFVARSLEADGFSSAGTVTSSDGIEDVWTVPGVDVAFAAHAGDAPNTEVVAAVPAGSWEQTVPVVLRGDRGPTGRLAIRLRAADGSPVRQAVVTLYTSIADAIVERVAARSDAGEYAILDLRAGTYRVEVLPGRTDDWGPSLEFHHPIEQPVTIRGEAETALDLRTRIGGRLRLTFRTAAGGALPDDLRLLATAPAGGEPVRLGFLTVLPDGWTTELSAGKPALGRDLLEPGRYLLRATGTGVRDAETLVDVVAGQVVDAEVTLEPK